MRDLSIEGKITIFKTLAFSKIVLLNLITSVAAFIIEQLNIIKKNPHLFSGIQKRTLNENNRI